MTSPTFSSSFSIANNELQLASMFNEQAENLPVSLTLSANSFNLVANAQLSAMENNTTGANECYELVLFSDTNIARLESIMKLLNIDSMVLSAINSRADKVSYRFDTGLNNVESVKSALDEYALNNNFELALVKNAPSLSEPGLLVMDMDSTTIQIECIDEIAKLAGVGEEVSKVTELAMQGELDFAESLRARVATLKDAPESILQQVADDLPLMHGLEVLLQNLKQHNWKVAVASGGFTYYTEILKAQLGLDATQANDLEIVDGKLTGKVLGSITDAQVKADTLLKLATQYGISNQQTVAMGDGANDLTMMQAANLGVAFEAKPVVLKQASCAINFSGLDCMLHWLK